MRWYRLSRSITRHRNVSPIRDWDPLRPGSAACAIVQNSSASAPRSTRLLPEEVSRGELAFDAPQREEEDLAWSCPDEFASIIDDSAVALDEAIDALLGISSKDGLDDGE